MRALVVIHPFGDYRRGDRITDSKTQAEVLAGENASSVVASEHPDEPAAPKTASASS